MTNDNVPIFTYHRRDRSLGREPVLSHISVEWPQGHQDDEVLISRELLWALIRRAEGVPLIDPLDPPDEWLSGELEG